MKANVTHPMPVPRLTVRGAFGEDVETLFTHKLAPVARHAHVPVLDVRVWLRRRPGPAVADPVEVRVYLDVNGRLVRAEATAPTARDAADLVVDRLLRQLHGRPPWWRRSRRNRRRNRRGR